MTNSPDLCQRLEWDTGFFGRQIARVVPSRLRRTMLDQVMAWCADQRIDCLYFLADSDDIETVSLVEEHKFRFVDIRLTMERSFTEAEALFPDISPNSIRPCKPEDIPALRTIASTSYQASRFYYDPYFSTEQCRKLYETWIERSCHDYADTVLVATDGNQPLGFITCHLKPGQGEIGLVGVNSATHGQGIGRALVSAALHWFFERDTTLVTVVTQGRNIGAQRLYQHSGFVTQSVKLWYHRWFVWAEDNS
jgi:dTDP-4-amino-4,6-dideoxy-D-galactose acyltransferase